MMQLPYIQTPDTAGILITEQRRKDNLRLIVLANEMTERNLCRGTS